MKAALYTLLKTGTWAHAFWPASRSPGMPISSWTRDYPWSCQDHQDAGKLRANGLIVSHCHVWLLQLRYPEQLKCSIAGAPQIHVVIDQQHTTITGLHSYTQLLLAVGPLKALGWCGLELWLDVCPVPSNANITCSPGGIMLVCCRCCCCRGSCFFLGTPT